MFALTRIRVLEFLGGVKKGERRNKRGTGVHERRAVSGTGGHEVACRYRAAPLSPLQGFALTRVQSVRSLAPRMSWAHGG